MRRIESLDALRAVAALSVLFYHLKELAGAPLGNFMWFGWVGVELFFVLSGLFIGLAVIAPREWEWRRFLERRVRRIVPAFYVSLFITVALINSWFLVNQVGWRIIGHHLLLIHNLFTGSAGGINGAYWTLGVEFQFYLLMMLCAPLLRSRRILPLLALWFAICFVWRAGVLLYGAETANLRFFTATQLPGMLDLFSIGVVLAWLVAKRTWLERAARHAHWLAPLLLILAGALFALCIRRLGGYADMFYFTPAAIIGWRTLVGISFALLIVAMMLLNEYGLIRKVLRGSGIAYLGKISYSIYLYHLPVILSLQRAQVPGFPTEGWKLAVMTTVITILLAMVSYHLVEEPWYRPRAEAKLA